MPVANLGWSRCLWSLASSPQVPLLLRAPQSALDRGQGEGETGRQKALITTSITLSVVLESPPSRRTLLPCVLRHSPYNQRTRMLRGISGTTLSNPLTVQVLYNLFHFKSPVTLRCLPATPLFAPSRHCQIAYSPSPCPSSFCNPSFTCRSWKLLIAKSLITLQLPKPMNTFPISTCIFAPQMLLTAPLGDSPLQTLVTPLF